MWSLPRGPNSNNWEGVRLKLVTVWLLEGYFTTLYSASVRPLSKALEPEDACSIRINVGLAERNDRLEDDEEEEDKDRKTRFDDEKRMEDERMDAQVRQTKEPEELHQERVSFCFIKGNIL